MNRFQVCDIEMECHISGQGQPLVLVHGFPLDHQMWLEQIAYFTDHYQVIAPDLRGFGKSQRGTASLTMERLADDVEELLRQIVGSQTVCFCGLSMGGYVAWEFGRKYKERVSHWIFCDTRASADDEKTARGRRIMARSVLINGIDEMTQTMPARLVSAEWRLRQPENFQHLQDVICKASPRSVADGLLAMSLRCDATDWLTSIDCPALLVVGEHDTISSPVEMRSMAAAIGNSRLLMVPAAGHLSPLENPEVVNRTIHKFLRGEMPSDGLQH